MEQKLMHVDHFFNKCKKLAKERAAAVGHCVQLPDFQRVGKDGMGIASLDRLQSRLKFYEGAGKEGTSLKEDILFWQREFLSPGEGGKGKWSGRKVRVHLRLAHECRSSRDGLRAGSVINKMDLPSDLYQAFTDVENISAKVMHREKGLFFWALQWNHAVNKLQAQGLEIETFVVSN